ncbi:MAG: hypothetical protein BA870_07105 [Desulfuromonadales bacterium C00003094]|nr:MAG: hypothetical protein BA870_07105 [Desulfuromonadales bacterium C00003094]
MLRPLLLGYSASVSLAFWFSLTAGFLRCLVWASVLSLVAVAGSSASGFLRGRPRRAGFFLASAAAGSFSGVTTCEGSTLAAAVCGVCSMASAVGFFAAGLRVRRRFGFSSVLSLSSFGSSTALAGGAV